MDRVDEHTLPDAMILAGGLGTRLRAAVADRPKPMAEVANRPFIAFLLDQLIRYGFKRAVICVGHMGEYVPKILGDSFGPLQLLYSFEQTPLGTGGALRHGVGLTGGDDILAMNGDSFCDIDLLALERAHLSFGGKGTLAVLEQSDRRRAGTVQVDATGRIVEFASRPATPTPGLINAGIYLLRREVLLAIPPDTKVSLEESVFPGLAATGGLYAWQVDARFIDIGTPESYAAAQTFF
jgi:NDP-sugar pyrophosphorylase family protein